MSIEITKCVWELDLPRNEKFVALALADHADKSGLCWPSMRRIAWKTGYGERQIRTIIRSLLDRGILRVVSDTRGGRGNSNTYQLQPEKGAKVAAFVRRRWVKPGNPEPERGQGQTRKAAICNTKAAIASAYESSEPSKESLGNTSAAAPVFPPVCLLKETEGKPTPRAREYSQDVAWLASKARASLADGRSAEETKIRLRDLIAEDNLGFDDFEIAMVMRGVIKPGSDSRTLSDGDDANSDAGARPLSPVSEEMPTEPAKADFLRALAHIAGKKAIL